MISRILYATTLLVSISCANETEFGGSVSATTAAFTEPQTAESLGAEVCDGDKVKIAWSNPSIQSCMDSGKVWHFPNKYDTSEYCSDVKAASSYDCSRSGFIDFSEAKGVGTSILVDKLSDGSKLVSCGESNEGSDTWAMAQFVTSTGSTDSCNVTANPITACFVSGSTGCAEGDYDCIVQWCFDEAS
jgi:hypothetical protein